MAHVAYVGNFEPEYSTENDVRVALESLGHTVTCVQENRMTLQRLRDAAFNADLLLWTGTWERANGPNHCPTTISLDDALDVLHGCAVQGIPTATLHLDIFWGVSRNSRRWWLHPMFHTGTMFTADGDHQTEWEHAGIRHIWLPPAVRHTAVHDGTVRDGYRCDVGFAGSDGTGYHTEWPMRRNVVAHLRAMCARNGWGFKNPGGADPKIARDDDMNDFYASATVTVGDSLCPLRETSRYYSDRVYEAPGRGGLLIMPQIDVLETQYESMLPMYPWEDWEALEAAIRYYLEVPSANLVAREACQQIVARDHTYVNRVTDLLEAVL